jgi:hypothetical protein
MCLLPYNFILRLIGMNVDIFNKSIASSKWIPVFLGITDKTLANKQRKVAA